MIFGICVLGVPLAIFGSRYGISGALTGWVIGAIGIGIPFDRFLEIKFSVLKKRKEKTSNNSIDGD
ncbi:MAG: hypothetical protein ACQEQC_08495 [Elusimicrobiota bacterium]